MAEQKKPPMFRAGGISKVGSAKDGSYAYVELFDVSSDPLALAFPAAAASELANRIMQAGDLAQAQQSGGPQGGEQTAAPAALVTEHIVVPSPDGETILLTLMAGPVPFVVRVSASRSQKLRASLERCEDQIGASKG